MKTIMIDMDEVICDSGWLGVVNDFLNTSYTYEDVEGYYIERSLVPENRMADFVKFFVSKNIYDYAEVFPGAYEVLEKLNKKYELYICTAYYNDFNKDFEGRFIKCKFDYLQKELPFIDSYNYIFINNKNMVKADIRIDDKLSNLHDDAEIKILFSSYHNGDISAEELKENNVIKVNNWKEIADILLND